MNKTRPTLNERSMQPLFTLKYHCDLSAR